MMKEFSECLRQKTQEAERALAAWLPEAEGPQRTVLDAMRYAVEAGGKRLRPVLIMESYRLFFGCACQADKSCPEDSAQAGGAQAVHALHQSELPGDAKCECVPPLVGAFMAAMEMIHTFSLCHDDLPCMDNDRYRRGRLSTWAKYGEDMGTLAGDALSLYAFEAVLRALRLPGTRDEDRLRALAALDILAKKSGVSGMLGGQVVDVEMTGKPLSEEQLMFVYRLKTGALLEASLMIGAALAGADAASLAALERIGQKVGVAFQIQDDILDETSTQEVLGKPIHSDAENQKTTYVSLHGLEAAHRAVETLSEEALQELDSLKAAGDGAFLRELIVWLIHREK